MGALLAKLPSSANVERALGRALIISLLGDHAVASAEFATIARRWPTDVNAAWLALNYCQKDRDCDPAPFLAHVLDVDRDNAVAWLASLDSAHKHRDEGGVAISLRRAAHALTYDPQDGAIFVFVRPILGQLAVPPSCVLDEREGLRMTLGHEPTAGEWADVFAQGMEMASIGVGGAVLQTCDVRKHTLSTARRNDCIETLGKMALGDSMLMRDHAMSSLIRLLDVQASMPWRERYRQLRWLREVAGTTIEFPEGTAARIWSDGEGPTFQSLAANDGLGPPPAGWLPGETAARRLIVEGR